MPIKYVESALVAATMAGAGYLFAVSATTANGVGLRAETLSDIGSAQQNMAGLQEQRAYINDLERDAGQIIIDSGYINDEDAATLDELGQLVGTRPVAGPGLEVTLDDARHVVPELMEDPEKSVVHGWQIQAVVNALRAGGAAGIAFNGTRLSPTSQARCAGNTVIMDGMVFSPAYRITAIGDPRQLRAALSADESVRSIRTAAAMFGLTYEENVVDSFMMDALEVPPQVKYAKAISDDGEGATPESTAPEDEF